MVISYPVYQVIIFVWITIAIIVFFLLNQITAPYGRHTSGKWGPLIDNHWAWLLMEFPALLVMVYFFVINISSNSLPVLIMIGLFCFHYFNRVFIFPFRLHTKGKKMPLIIMTSAIFFNLCDTFLLGYYFTHFTPQDTSWLTDGRFITGSVLFFIGLIINWKADDILIHLRKPDETGYKIPGGWLFEYVSCPNMMGELIEWCGFALLCWNLPAFAFFIWSAANLVPRAIAHHRWYKNNFSDYPGNRKAVIPFIV
jgi:3-oxo-5-alpha-steroid 4-dehydrogenase 1